jgi:hypothetical protein
MGVIGGRKRAGIRSGSKGSEKSLPHEIGVEQLEISPEIPIPECLDLGLRQLRFSGDPDPGASGNRCAPLAQLVKLLYQCHH